MTDHRVSPGGVIIATYEPAGGVATGSFHPVDYQPSDREVARQARMQTKG